MLYSTHKTLINQEVFTKNLYIDILLISKFCTFLLILFLSSFSVAQMNQAQIGILSNYSDSIIISFINENRNLKNTMCIFERDSLLYTDLIKNKHIKFVGNYKELQLHKFIKYKYFTLESKKILTQNEKLFIELRISQVNFKKGQKIQVWQGVGNYTIKYEQDSLFVYFTNGIYPRKIGHLSMKAKLH